MTRTRPGRKRRSGCDPVGTTDAVQLSARGKLRRVTRHRERYEAAACSPRRDATSAPSPRRDADPQGTANLQGDAPHPRVGTRQGPAAGPAGPGRKDREGRSATARRLVAGRGRGAGYCPRPETWRTPRSVSGCNRPEKCQVEQAAEAGRNGRGGTRPGAWQLRAEGGSASHGEFPRERTGRQLFGAAVSPGVDTGHPCRWRGGL